MQPSVLIIGATSDIARAVAEQYAGKGYHIILSGRNKSATERIASDIKIRYQTETSILEMDVKDSDSHFPGISALNPFPEIVLCAAGYLGDQQKAESDIHEARNIMETNYNGCVSILSAVAVMMEKRGQGTIIGIGSVAGDRGRMSNYFYGSAKAGFEAFLSGLRSRMAKKGVHVLTVKPGFVKTKMTSGMDLPPLLTATPARVARDIYKAAQKKQNVLYTLWFWRYIMLIIRLIPEFIFKKTRL
jgi:decaprenylphospho-beta-D-erythro-pentofuranosid-2-ulose 2-reductase